MPGLITVLPYRYETGITLKNGGVIEISQTDENGDNRFIEIHASDAPLLIDAIKSAINEYDVELTAE